MSTLQAVELGVLGPLQVRKDGTPVVIPGAKPRAILTMLGLHSGSVVSAETLIELLWGDDPPRTAAKALPTHISALRRALGDGFVLTEGTGWTLAESEVDASRYKSAARLGRDAAAAGDMSQAVVRFQEALALWRGIPELPDGRRGTSEKTQWIEGHAALVEDRADALLATGRAAEIIGELEAAVAEAPLRERRWGQLMLALYRAGRQGDALGAYQRARSLLADELGVDPGSELRRLEAAVVAQDAALDIPVAQNLPSITRTVTFLLTDIEGSTAAWEADADAMAVALARHDELVEQVVTSRGGRLIKTRGEGDATFSVFERATAAAAAAIELQDAIFHEPWRLQDRMRIRVALHTGEVELRDGDYFGRAVNRAARLRSLAIGGQILCSGAIAELVIDALPDDVVLADLGMRQLKNLARPEHVFELRLETASDVAQPQAGDESLERPGLPAVLTGPGPFVGRGRELERLVSAWQTAQAGGTHAVLIAGEPGVGKTRLAGEWSQQAYQLEAIVLYGRCDEDLGAPYQPFAEALRSLVPCLGTSRLRGMRGVEALVPLVPGLTEVLPDLAAPTRADPDTERYALFDAVVALLEVASTSAPVVLVLDDLHWAAKPTLLLLRHLLRFGDRARVQIVGTYRSTDLDRSHPLAAMLADLHRGAGSGTANRLTLSGLDEDDVTAYVSEAGYNDEELARALASVTGGNPFFLIEALRHVDETGGVWDPTTLPQGVRETVSRRLSRLPAETNTALAAAAVVGSRFVLDLVEKVVEQDLVDPFDEACKAGIVIEEPGGRYRFNHAIVRQSLLAELPSVRRMRLHQRIATTLENEPGADDELLAELAHHYFECAWAGNAAKAVEYCRRAGDQAVARLGYEGAADLYGQALHALDEIEDELPDRADQAAELLVARCEALLAAGDVASAAGAVSKLQEATVNSARLAAWATCFDGQLSMLIHPERLDEVETALGLAAQKLAELDDAAGEANAHTVRAACLARLGRIGDGEIALDDALTAARRARDHRRVNAVLAGAPLAALWGPNPVPRAGGRCLDVVRLLRITTDSPAVEATSTRCQAVLEAFRGRAEAARRMIDSARRTVTELGLRHALLEVEQFAGIVELIADDPTAAEPHFRQAYNGFRRMGLDADAAETAALLGRTCLALDRHTEADELCLESERLAGHALKASIAWRTLRARLLSRGREHGEARRIAEAAVALAERTDALVDHGDACASLATVLDAGGDAAGARAAAERAVDLYERKGAAALADKARRILGEPDLPSVPAPPEPPPAVELDNACTRAGKRLVAAVNRGALDEYEQLHAPNVFSESHRKALGFTHAAVAIVPPENWAHEIRRVLGTTGVRLTGQDIAVRGERLALARVTVGTADVSPGAPHDEFLQVYGVDEEGRISLQIWFDLEDLDAAIAELDAAHARFEEEAHRQMRRLENAATRLDDQAYALFANGRCDEIGALYADNIRLEDRRQGLRRESNDRATAVNNVRAIAALGANVTYTPLALRGDRLCLSRVRFEERDPLPEAFGVETLQITAVDTDGVMIAQVVLDPDDFEAAIAELDARYLAGEAADYANTWSVISGGHGALNRREMPPLTPDCVSIDHRRGAAFAPGELTAYFRAGFDLNQDIQTYVEVVHRLSDLGAVCTHAAHGVSHEGFDAEWRGIDLLTIDGNMVNRCEVFDEANLDAALARFDQLGQPAAPRLENVASHAAERYMTHFAAGEWGELAKVLADDICVDDRRRSVNAGIKHGRDAEIANLRAAAEVGITYLTSVVIAVRGQRLILARVSGGQGGSGEFRNEVLGIIEIDSQNQISAIVVFDVDDLESALAELDARYLAGEAAAYGNVLQPVMDTVGELNRHEPGPMLGRLSFADHRRVPVGSAENYGRAIEELWTLVPDARYWMRAVHALDAHGLVSTLVIEGTDAHGNELQWGRTFLFLSDGPLVEVYEEADLDVALARFDELRPQARRLENAASHSAERYMTHFASRDWDALAKVLAEGIFVDDRRRAVNAGIRHGRDAEIANLRAAADVGIAYFTSVVIAARGERLVLARVTGGEAGSGGFLNDVLGVVETDSDNQIAAIVVFDVDDFDAALAELDARYLAGEAAAYAHMWSWIMAGHAALNRQELPPITPDCVSIDHRLGTAFAPGELVEYLRAGWDLKQTIRNYVEVVHRLSDLGAVWTDVGQGVSDEGFDAEWRTVDIMTVEGDMVNRCEIFDEADLDAAIARFDELNRLAPHLENAVSRLVEQFLAHFAGRDWDAVAELVADDMSSDDRRRVINAGTRLGRDGEMANWRATSEVWTNVNATVVATRGERLALFRFATSQDQPTEGFQGAALSVIEINDDNRAVASVVFDFDDLEAAIAELDARYLAGEAAAHAHTWSVITKAYAALNRREQPPTTPDWVNIDHRRGTSFASGEMPALLDAAWNFTTDLSHSIEAVHRLSDLGAVVTNASHETSQEGFDAEWRVITVATVQGDMLSRCEVFDEADLDAALARFDQLSRPAPRLENAASRVDERFAAYFAAREWDAMAELTADSICVDDRRHVVNAGVRRGRDAEIANLRARAETGMESITSAVVAVRGERLALTRTRFWGHGQRPEDFHTEALCIIEIDSDERIVARVGFDLDDFEAGVAELDARYLAGEAAGHARTWSLIAQAYNGFNRGEMPAATRNWVNADHRHAAAMAPGEAVAYFHASWELAAELNVYIEAVHRLSDLGAVFTHVGNGTSREGFEAEWRTVDIMTLEGELVNRVELFDEADLDAALAAFDQLSRPAPRLENIATRVFERLYSYVAAGDWHAVAQISAENVCVDDRRRVVNAGILHGRDANIKDAKATVDVGFTMTMLDVLATRGGRLALTGVRVSGPDPKAIQNDALQVVEIDSEERIAGVVVFDLNDFDAAFAELDARYLAGEAAAHARAWSVIVNAFVAHNRREIAAATPDAVSVDHRRGAAFAPGQGLDYIRAGWDLDQNLNIYIETAHRVNDLGAVFTWAGNGTSHEGFDAEWRGVNLMTVDGEMVDRAEVFDEEDLDAALATFDQLSGQAPRLENAATRVFERLYSYFAAGDWDAAAQMTVENVSIDDRRRVVNVGIRHGRDANIKDAQATVDVGFTMTIVGAMATRGERLALLRVRAAGSDPETIQNDALNIVEIDADERIAGDVVFDLDDFDAAIAELDARYVAGEAAAHAAPWSVITGFFAAHNRREIAATTSDVVSLDHRRAAAFASGEGFEYIRAGWDLGQNLNIYIETAHRVNDLGAVFTFAGHGSSHEGFDAEWRGVTLMTAEGEMVSRMEVFDEGDLDAALAKFDQLSQEAPRLGNAASRVDKRFQACFAARDWDAMAEMLSDGFSVDDRRRVVNAGSLQGRDAELIVHAYAALGSQNVTSTVVATRAQRLVLSRYRFSDRDPQPDAFRIEMLVVVEIDAYERMATAVVFDVDEFEGAIAELDARYLAGEAAAHAHTWSAIASAYAALNQHELPPTTPGWVNIDHRRGQRVEADDLGAFISATWDVVPQGRVYVEAVHRLSDLGVVITHAARGTSHEGFDAEWRAVNISTVDGDMVSRSEVFDEADLEVALAKFDELSRPTPRLDNAASRVGERYLAYIAAGDWNAMAEILTDDFSSDDRRRVVGAGVRHGRDAVILDMRAIADLALMSVTSTVMATRGERLVLMGARYSGRDRGPEGAFLTEVLGVFEIDADERIVAAVSFDVDEVEAAIAELDARHLAGEAGAHAHTWSVVTRAYAAANRQQLQLAPDCVTIDHRRARAFAPGELREYMHATWDLAPNVRAYVEAVQQLSNLGAVVTHAAYGTSHEGFDAEWREVSLLTVDGDMINRCELFDEADLDAALARFEELHPLTPRLENTASRMVELFLAHFAVRDWDGMAELLADNFSSDDRRRVINAGIRRGRDAEIANWRTTADVWMTGARSTAVATRGERLVLFRIDFLSQGPPSEAFHAAALTVIEIDDDNRGAANVVFDVDDIGAAFAELDARYLAGEAGAHAHTWSVISQAYAALNRRELPATTRDWTSIDNRRFGTIEPNALTPNIRAFWDITSEARIDVTTVHKLTNLGAVVAHATRATSREAVEIESGEIIILMVDGDLLSRCEIFDEADIDTAVARFDELSRPARRLENAASRVHQRFLACFAAGDWDAIAEIMAEDFSHDDRRPVVGAGVQRGRDAYIVDMRAVAELWNTNLESTVVAIRGERLVLMRNRLSARDEEPEAFSTEVLAIGEIDADGRGVAVVTFDVDNVDAAFAELDARYLAGEAASHAHTWSVIAGIYAGFNRREPPATTPGSVFIDHRPLQNLGAVDLGTAARPIFDIAPDLSLYIEAVHRLGVLGAVVTQTLKGTSQAGLDAEWRMIQLLTVEGDLLSRCEVFDEADLDAALARFDELNPQAPRLENAASQVTERLSALFAARDWDAIAELLADDISSDDRRRVVGAGPQDGRDAVVAEIRAIVDLGPTKISSTVIATRGGRLVLNYVRYSGTDKRPDAFQIDILGIVEINTDNRVAAYVTFDLEDIDAAFEELDARYLAGEAATHARTWSAIAGVYAAFNRRELPAPDYVTIDHRRATLFTSNELAASIRDSLDLTPDLSIHIEAVHRLNNFGALLTNASYGTSQAGFDAEWRMIQLLTVEGDKVNRLELFDETDLDAALARFEELQPPPPRPENTASRVDERLRTHLAARDWAAMANLLTEDTCTDDRRRIVNVGIRRGRDVTIAYGQAMADLGVKIVMSDVVAIRGERLFLSRARWLGPAQQSEDFHTEVLNVVEIDLEQRIAARVMFDADDTDAAFEELDARYLAGEAAPHAHTWSIMARERAAFNRRELTAADYITIDHRPLPIIEAFSQAALQVWDVTPDFGIHMEAVHRLRDFGAVATYQANGTSPEGFDGEWRFILLLTAEGDRINRCEVFDESDLDAALARFDELQPQAPRLENTASQIIEQYQACFAARDWAAMAELLAEDIVADDRRRVVNAGVRRGREVHIADMRATVEVSAPTFSSSMIATRGERVALADVRIFNRGMTGEVGAEMLGVAEIDADQRMVAIVSFDLDDIDAAFQELDARYLAGEAASHAHAWSVITSGYAAFNRREVPQTTQDWVSIDHRRAIAFAPGELNAYMQATWEMAPDVYTYADAAHRLSDLGAVVTQVSRGTSQQGFDGEWREIVVVTVEGDLINRIEIFEEADLDAALARFEELHPQAPRLENAASRVYELFWTYFAARDWAAMAEILNVAVSQDDRRRVVNAGIRKGRDAFMTDMRAVADVGTDNLTSTVIATRGNRLALSRVSSTAFETEVLNVVEIDADERIVAIVAIDHDDIDAAFAELDARYLAGEAAACARFWSVVTDGYAQLNKHELPPWTSDWLTIDHRMRATFEAADQTAYIRGAWDITPDLKMYIEAVHRLSNFGAVVTHTAYGSTQDGFDAEWRMVELLAAGDDNINRCELFDETDLDAALARFEELQPPAPRLGNAATQVHTRLKSYVVARDWEAMAEFLADDIAIDDRRRAVNSGMQYGRDAAIRDMRGAVDLGLTNIALTTVATRGARLELSRTSISGEDRPDAFRIEFLSVVEINANERIVARVAFDLDDIDAAFKELDARYLAGEAARHTHTWSVILGSYAATNRRELPQTTQEWVSIDHRRAIAFAPGELIPYIQATWEMAPDVYSYVEAAHRLSDLGAVVTQAVRGTSQQGFDGEWREIIVVTVEGDLINRIEIFDEADIDTALARFEELHPQPPQLDNAATQVQQRFWAYFAARDWDAMTALVAYDISTDDRRRVVNAGVLHGRDDHMANMRAIAEVGAEHTTSTVMATRGARLALTRLRSSNRNLRPDEVSIEVLCIVEIGADNRIVALVGFDPDDIDAAFEELDTRYLAGEAAPYSNTWPVISHAYAAFNRHELAAADWITIDHRQGTPFASSNLTAAIRASLDLTPDLNIHIESVHRLTHFGVVITHTQNGTSPEGFNAEWRMICLLTVEGGRTNRLEIFEEEDLDAALARFDELEQQTPSFENAATRIWTRLADAFNRRDVDGCLALSAADVRYEDRRKGLRDALEGTQHAQKAVQATFEATPRSVQMTVEPIAIRGSRLSLSRVRYCDTDFPDRPITVEILQVSEVNHGDLIQHTVSFDPDDIDAAFAELTARWIALGEVAYPEVIESVDRINTTINRHDWDTVATYFDGAEYVNHRQLADTVNGTIADWLASLQTTASLAPDLWVELAEVLARSAIGIVGRMALKGTSTDGAAIEIPVVVLILLRGQRVTRLEAFDEDQRDLALARLQELNRPV